MDFGRGGVGTEVKFEVRTLHPMFESASDSSFLLVAGSPVGDLGGVLVLAPVFMGGGPPEDKCFLCLSVGGFCCLFKFIIEIILT